VADETETVEALAEFDFLIPDGKSGAAGSQGR